MSVTANLAESLRLIVARVTVANAEGNSIASAFVPMAVDALKEYDTGHAPERVRGQLPAELVGKLYGVMENVVELTSYAVAAGYQPEDSRDVHSNVIAWAVTWEAEFYAKVAAGEWDEDEWIERTEDYARAKLGEVKERCTNWPN